jgi:hypothetical protein
LIVSATFAGPQEQAPGVAREIADRIGASGVDLSAYESLRVTVRREARRARTSARSSLMV